MKTIIIKLIISLLAYNSYAEGIVLSKDNFKLKCKFRGKVLHIKNKKLKLQDHISLGYRNSFCEFRTLTRSESKMTTFKPAVHGFKFKNRFKSTVGDSGSLKLTFGGLCGGMAYAANDYFLSRKRIPSQTFTPAIGSELYNYIYERQQNSFTNMDKFLEFSFNPFGSRDREFFYWGLEGRLFDLKKCIDMNTPVPLGLFNVHNDPTKHHQVLAIGYDLGGYRGKKEKDTNKGNVRIFIYDPNYPNKVCVLIPVPNENAYHQQVGAIVRNRFVKEYSVNKKWRSYFVDGKFKKKSPPALNKPNVKNANKVNRLLFSIKTGGDDLRGGHDNVHFHICFKDGSNQTILNANKRQRWPDKHTQNVEVYLNKAVNLEEITNVKLETTFGGGWNGDNWNMDSLKITAFKGDDSTHTIFDGNNSPLKRFTGDHQWFAIR